MPRQSIGMFMLHFGSPRDEEARDQLAAALRGADVGEPDDEGVFEVEVDAAGQQQALERIWDAVAASGTDDHIALLAHPELPEHWRERSARPGG